MINKKILSICIPTYNRANLLNRLLGMLESELLDIHDDVEICISDNCSTDGTQKVCLDWQKKLPLIYSKTSENLGYDRNALNVIKMAYSKYLWFMGDDDLVVKDSVRKLVASIANVDLGVVYLNSFFRNQWVLNFDFKDFCIFRKEELKIPLNLSFGGGICLNRLVVLDIIDNLIEEREGKLYKKNFGDFVFHDFIHTYLFLECLVKHGFVGIAPLIGMEYMSGLGVSYKKKFYLELLMLAYILEMKKYYPWFNEDVAGKFSLKSHFARLAIVIEDSSLEAEYCTNYNALLELLAIEKKPIHIAIVKFSEMSRKLPFLRWFWIILYKIVQGKFCAKFNSEQDQNVILTENFAYLIHRTNELL